MFELIMSLFTSLISKSGRISKEPSSEIRADAVKIETVGEEGNYYVWDKGDDLTLSKFFSTKEFSCHCDHLDCKKQRVSKTLITRLDAIRVESNQSLRITSGFRCGAYQTFLRNTGVNTVVAKKSTHELGDAADVQPKDGKIDAFLLVVEKQFDSIGLAKTFLHVDTRVGKRRWNY